MFHVALRAGCQPEPHQRRIEPHLRQDLSHPRHKQSGRRHCKEQPHCVLSATCARRARLRLLYVVLYTALHLPTWSQPRSRWSPLKCIEHTDDEHSIVWMHSPSAARTQQRRMNAEGAASIPPKGRGGACRTGRPIVGRGAFAVRRQRRPLALGRAPQSTTRSQQY